MKRSTLKACRLARLATACFFAMSILFMMSSSNPWAKENVAPSSWTIRSTGADFESRLTPASPVAATGNFTLNKYIYPGNTAFSSLSPPTTTTSPISSWSIGVPILYVITIGNSNPAQNNLVNVTLRDTLSPSALNANFVALKVSCDAFGGAVCPFATNVPVPTLPLDVPNIQIKVGTEVVLRIEGYYKTQGTFQNTFSVFETGKQATTEEQGPPKNVQITNNWSVIDLKLAKTSSTTATSLSATTPATIRYELTLTGDSSQDFYPENLLRIQDAIIATYPPLPSYSISNYTCSSLNGSTCPGAPSPLNPNPSSISGGNSYAYTYLVWPSGSSTVIKKNDIITIKFDLDVKAGNCGNSLMTVQNQASITTNPFTYTDSNNGNNYNSPTTQNSFTTGLLPCPPSPGPPGTITKKLVCPSSGCPIFNWGDTATYEIVVKNNLATVQTFQVSDYVSKESITVPVRATLVPSTSAADVSCSPAICTTTPETTLPPYVQDVLVDAVGYNLFHTKFTLQPTGSTGGPDSVTLTFNVKIDKLAECDTDPGNRFNNQATLFVVSPNLNTAVSTVTANPVQLPELPSCNLSVTKTLDSPLSGVTFGQPVSYTVKYENLGSQPITVRTLRDALNVRDTLNSNPYGNIPITNLTANCTTTTGVSPMPSYQLGHTQIYPTGPGWGGFTIIYEPNPATGITFPGGSKLQCTVSFTPHEPSATDNYCKGSGLPEILNNAYLDVSAIQTGIAPTPPYFAQAKAPLPLCRKVALLKTIGGGVASTGPNGPLTFQIAVTNYGNDPVSNFLLNDPLPSGFTDSGAVVCNPACLTAGFTGTGSSRVLNASFNPIPGTAQSPNNTVTLTFNVSASPAGGTYQNTATGSFGASPPGTNFYFEGDPAVLLVNSAQVQVLTPTLTKSVQPNSMAVNGSAVLTFTITNQTSDPAQSGISFKDSLPAGVTITSAPATACGGAVSVSGGNTLTLSNGALAQGQHQCQFAVKVTASSCGQFVNDKSNFSQVANLDVTNALATLTVSGCDDPQPTDPSCGVKTNEISCNTDGTGGYLYTFTVTNNTGRVVTDVLLTPKPNSGITITPQQPPLPSGGLDIGASHTWTVTINGGKPKEKACFTVTLMTADGECCSTEVCQVLPECCAAARDVSIECNKDGTFTYTLSIVNTGVNPIEHFYLYPPAGVTMTPNYFAALVKPSDTFTTKVTIKGAKPGDRLCFDISLHTANMESCCKGQLCIVLPDCKLTSVR